MTKNISKNSEFDRFSKIAKEWWKPKGKFKILHQITPLRIEYILSSLKKNNIKNLEILDLGCGGGLVCEPLTRLKAKVTGIDFIKENIEVAKTHAIKSKLKINYIHQDINNINLKKKYDLILILEVLEHLDDWQFFIKKIKKNLKPKGKVIISTINRTLLAKFFAIFVAENILNLLPKKTHDYNKLITPQELKNNLTNNKFTVQDLTGMNLNLLSNKWELNKNFYYINYFCTALLN